ncbi:MAG: serine hydrolase domain-containing protein [Gemmatimonadota bacterium]
MIHRPTRARAVPSTVLALTAAALAAGGLIGGEALAQTAAPYYPGPSGDWESRSPEQVGMDAGLLEEAIEFARANESDSPRDLALSHALSWNREPFDGPVGPFKTRGPATGVIVRNGYIVAEWGDPWRVDMTFSVTKSFLSSTVGLAWDRGLIRDLDEPVRRYAPFYIPAEPEATDPVRGPAGAPVMLFDSEHNRRISWDHLLRQTSDWEGRLFGKPDWADRPSGDPDTWLTRDRNEPGTAWKYNDVRVNLLALAATYVWREPLPRVLREQLMDPIGASRTWQWHGYANSWVVVDGRRVQSVSGGGHWGGGMWISARDQARFGLLTLRRGRWADEQILSEEWIEMARTPTAANEGYGFMNFFLNTGRERFPAAPESAFAHLGAGTNMVYVDPENDLVVVARWIRGGATAELIERVLAAVREPATAF